MAKKDIGKIAIGISCEGSSLHVVKVERGLSTFSLLAAREFQLKEKIEAQEFTEDIDDLDSLDDISIEIDADEELDSIEEDEPEEDSAYEDDAVFLEILELAKEKKCRLALSVTEPHIFYKTFETDWGLTGSKLLDRVNTELISEKESYHSVDNDAIATIKITDDRLMAVVRAQDISLFDHLIRVKQFSGYPLPKIAFVESTELSLVNLVIEKFSPNESTNTLILHVGSDFSRFTILVGEEIYHISDTINVDASSPDVVSTLNHRLMFLLDTLSPPTIDHIVLTGLAEKVGMIDFFNNLKAGFEFAPDDHFIENFVVQVIDLHDYDITDLDSDDFINIHPYAIALGAATRALTADMPASYQIDLTSKKIKESQRRLVMTPVSWVLLALIPIIISFSLVRIANYKHELKNLEVQLATKRIQFEQFQALEATIGQAHSTLGELEATFSIVDSLLYGTKIWTTFWMRLNIASRVIDNLWFTEITGEENNIVTLKGYSIFRNRIPRLVMSLGKASLKKVEVQEIRGKTVYRFEIEAIADVEKMEL
ncbi:MAG: hypothetical protein P9L92_20825 [Candidatus Electryonea clarkiae]|nr:hypothetical protein [Candidatus Electryonea clarkiae]MDP8288523.1 hypothetical protein [Candidatus Electryonea clarkiae]